MAGATSQVALDGDDWAELASGVTGAIIQLISNGPVLVHVAGSAPSAGSVVGIMLHKDGITTLPLTGLESGTDIVYGKCKGDESETVTVLVTGSA